VEFEAENEVEFLREQYHAYMNSNTNQKLKMKPSISLCVNNNRPLKP